MKFSDKPRTKTNQVGLRCKYIKIYRRRNDRKIGVIEGMDNVANNALVIDNIIEK